MTERIETRLWGRTDLETAAAALRAGQTVAFPTETVYGLGAVAHDPAAVARVFEAKGRPRFNPLIVHVADLAAACRVAALPEEALALAEAFWPGPLTLVAPLREGASVCDLATAGLPTVAARVPAHPMALALLRATGAPLVAPSANPSGAVSPTEASHVLEGLDGRIAGVVDGGPCAVGLESTIIDFGNGRPTLLRPGGLEPEMAEAVLRQGLVVPTAGGPVTAPGMLTSHYAPGAALRLDACSPRPGEAWLGFGPDDDGETSAPTLSLSAQGNLTEAAAHLFGHLRHLDKLMGHRGTIAVAPIPETGLGIAINDRLRRAAAPRPERGGPEET
jgi:L-threonylcarbamoyladenylate synthase